MKKRCKLHTRSLKYYCIFQLKMEKKNYLPSVVFIAVMLVGPTLGARDFSSAVSGFCQVFIVTRFSRGFGLGPKTCRPSANTENSRRTREKPLVPRVSWAEQMLETNNLNQTCIMDSTISTGPRQTSCICCS